MVSFPLHFFLAATTFLIPSLRNSPPPTICPDSNRRVFLYSDRTTQAAFARHEFLGSPGPTEALLFPNGHQATLYLGLFSVTTPLTPPFRAVRSGPIHSLPTASITRFKIPSPRYFVMLFYHHFPFDITPFNTDRNLIPSTRGSTGVGVRCLTALPSFLQVNSPVF